MRFLLQWSHFIHSCNECLINIQLSKNLNTIYQIIGPIKCIKTENQEYVMGLRAHFLNSVGYMQNLKFSLLLKMLLRAA